MFRFVDVCLTGLLFFFISIPVFAGDEVEEADSTLLLNNVTVNGYRSFNKITTTTPTQTLGKEDFTKLGIQSIADAVRRFAGTFVRDYGGIGGMKTVSVRNIGASHTAVSYDDIAVSNCQAGQIDIGRFSYNTVSSVSLSIGQEDNLLQSARLQASGAVLSIQTEEPVLSNRPYLVTAQARAGSFGLGEGMLQWTQRVNTRTLFSMSGEYNRADGNYPFSLKNGKQTTTEHRNNSHVSSVHGEANLFHHFKDSSQLKIKGYYFYSDRGLPGAVILYNNISNERLWDENFFVQGKYLKQFSTQWKMQAQAKYNHSWSKYKDTGTKYASTGGEQVDIHRQDEYYLQSTVQYSPTSHFDFSMAQDVVLNQLRSNFDEASNPTRYTSLTTFNFRYRNRKLKAVASLLNTFIYESVKQGEAPNNRERLTPALSLSYQPFSGEQFFVRAMYKQTYRVPSFNDLYYRRLGNLSLRPEKAQEYNVGITWSGTPLSFLDFLTVTADAYYNRVTDKIVAFPTTYVWKMANFGTVIVRGVDVTLGTGIAFSDKVYVRLTGGLTWQKAIDRTDANSKTYDNQLPYTPQLNGNGNLLVELPWLSIGYTMVGMGERYSMAQNLPEYRIEPFMEHTLTLSRVFQLAKSKLSVSGEVINLTDEQYSIIQYYPMPGRNFRVTLNYQF